MSMLSLDMICSANDEQVRKNTFHIFIHYVIHNVQKLVGRLITGCERVDQVSNHNNR